MRYNLLEKNKTEYGIDIYKSTTIPWNEFEFSKGYKKHILTVNEVLKFYLVSWKYFSTVDYEDLLLLINGIDDIFTVLPGTEIKIPYYDDINAFIIKYKK